MLKFLVLFSLFLNFSLSAEIIQKLNVKGNSRISEETIKVYGDISIGKNYTNFDIDEMLKNLYKTNFFEDIQVKLNNGILNIIVKEYSIINSIDIEGEKSNTIKEKVLEFLDLKSKESFIAYKLDEDIDKIRSIYSTMGFNFTSVDAKVEKFENNRINLIFIVTKGKKTNIAKINFTGDKKIKEKRLREIIVSEEKKFWKILSKNTFLSTNNIDLDKRLLVNYYKSLGYYDVQVLSNSAEISKDDFTTLTYTINAGSRYRVNKISTNVQDVLDKNLFIPLEKNFNKVLGKYYSPFTVKKLLEELDRLIENNDLQFVEHSVNEILENEAIEIKINIFEGKKILVEKIIIKGNNVTEEATIRSELLLDEGDPFSSLKLDKSIAKIKSRNLFSEVKKTISSGSKKDQKIIEITVEEKPTGEISAGAGIGTNGGNFAFTVVENNWLGKGVNVSTNLEVSAETFLGGIQITDPNYKFSGNSLSYFVSNTSNDKPDSGYTNNISTAGLGVKFEQYKDIYLAPRLTFAYDNLKVQNTASKALQKQKGTFSDLSFDYSIMKDNRDRVYSPTSGYISSFSQAWPVYADSPYVKNSYNFNLYNTFSEDLIGSFKFYTSAINGLKDEDVRLSKRILMPSSKLRGFEAGKIGPKDGVDFVGGNYAWASNFELSLPNLLPEATKTDVGLFLDFANLWNVDYDKQLDDSSKIRSTIGANTSWVSPVGPMTFVFSQNISKGSTDIVETFNFKLGTTF